MSPLTRLIAAVALAVPTAGLAADPAVVPAPHMHAGDSWIFDRTVERGVNGFLRGRKNLKVESADDDTMIVGVKPDGSPMNFEDHMLGLDWSQRRNVDGKDVVTTRPFSFPLAVGKTWTADFVDPSPRGAQRSAHFAYTYKVVGWEDVTTPAGVFHALKITGVCNVLAHMAASSMVVAGGAATTGAAGTVSQVQRLPERDVHESWREQIYYAPEVKYFVKYVNEHYNGEDVRTLRDTETLASYSVQP